MTAAVDGASLAAGGAPDRGASRNDDRSS